MYTDRFNRDINVIYGEDWIWQLTIDGWLTEEYSLNKRRMILTITDKIHTGQPKWWQFWIKEIDPTVSFKLPSCS